MTKKTSIMAGVAAVLVTLTTSIQAIPITGSITIQGSSIQLTSNGAVGAALGTANGVAANTGSVSAGLGAFSSVPAGTSVNFSAFTFNPITTPVLPLWSFTFLAQLYKFDLTSMTVNTYNASTLNISGTGTLSIGSDSTSGTWSYVINSSSPDDRRFSYQSINAVPDGGATVLLLGAAFSGLYCFRKKILT